MNNRLIPPKLCRWCHEPFTPRKFEQMFCPKPARCTYQFQSRERKGQIPVKAVEGKKRRDTAIREAKLGGRFGILSEREQAIFNFAHDVGYDLGYQQGYAPLRVKAS